MVSRRWIKGFVASAMLFVAQQSLAESLIIEGAPLAKRIVIVEPAALGGDPAALAELHRRLRTAAKSVCNEEYRGDTILFTRACVTSSVSDALDQFSRIRGHQIAARIPNDAKATILVRARQ